VDYANDFKTERDIKENLCFVSIDFKKQLAASLEVSTGEKAYKLPSGEVITIERELFCCPEPLFQPSLLVGMERARGVHRAVYDAAMRCEDGLREGLFANVVLSGGSSMFAGMALRLRKEVAALARVKVEVIAVPERAYAVWRGGSMLASHASFQSEWISKREYEESGVSIMSKKKLPLACF
jgi:actin-related protein